MRKLKIFGFDGLDYFTIRKNLGKLEHWKNLVKRFPLTIMWTNVENSRRPWKFDSAMLWTSMFTGKMPEEHGIWGYKMGIEGRETRREDVNAKFIWETRDEKFIAWGVPALIPLVSWRCSGVDQGKVPEDLNEWCDGVGHLLNSGTDFDVFISVYNETDHYQHHHWDDKPSLLRLYDKIAECVLAHVGDDDDVMIISDHGFTDINTALTHMWTWRYSKIKNKDNGHHAPWGVCATNLRWRPFKVSEVHEAIVRRLNYLKRRSKTEK